ncbi:MAG: hypothetical protein WD645_04505 [Dehalococcoidia bacterium]
MDTEAPAAGEDPSETQGGVSAGWVASISGLLATLGLGSVWFGRLFYLARRGQG